MAKQNPEIAAYKATKQVYETRTTCRVCGKPSLSLVLSLGDQYVANFVKDVDVMLPRVPLNLVQCTDCGLLQLRETTNPDILWRGHYWYRSGINATMRDALYDVVQTGLHFVGAGTWLDIGANDGTLLSRVPQDFKKIGCEPSTSMQSYLEEHADKVVGDFFSAESVGEPANVITSCAMFYDIDDPNRFVGDIVKTMTDDGIWINQLSNTPAMLEATAFDNICHEHACYYDIASLQKLYEQHGLVIISTSLNDVNGGSIRTVAAKRGMPNVLGIPKIVPGAVKNFCDRVRRWKLLAQEVMDNLPSMTSLWAYGASTKGCTLLQYLDRSDKFIGIADRNPSKWGLRMAGTWIPIVDEETMRQAKPTHLMALPWAFKQEFVAREAATRNAGTTMIWPLPEISFTL